MARRGVSGTNLLIVAIAASVAAVGFILHADETPRARTSQELVNQNAQQVPMLPLPQTIALDTHKIALGKRLFHEPRLSADGTVSCASCHNLATGGVDRQARSRGIGGQLGTINAPTVFNAGFNFRQFWDGRAASLEDQVNGPLQNPIEMNSTWPKAISTLSSDPSYRNAFAKSYPNGITPANVRDAIATFERSLITPDSRLDRYLRGEKDALNQQELAGYRLFLQIGCTSCHQGINIGGNLYQKLGIMEDYFAMRGRLTKTDLGLYNLTGHEEDRYYFKVPSLRNVALTGPYLHDGTAQSLEDAIKIMARFQLGKNLSNDDIAKLAAFLRSLTGEYQGKPLQ